MSEEITPTPPLWKDEKLQKLDNLLENAGSLKENWMKNDLGQADDEEKTFEKYARSMARIYLSIRTTLLSITDSKLLSAWISQYIEKRRNDRKVPFIFSKAISYPEEFWGRLDPQVSKSLYNYLVVDERFRPAYMAEFFPGLSKYA